MMSDLRYRISRLFTEYAWRLDAARYEEWLELFSESATYKIVPKENIEYGLPASLMLCKNKDMLRDRITSLLEVNKYNIHSTRHLLGASRLGDPVCDIVIAETPFAVYQTDQEGVSRLFGVGQYNSKISCSGSTLLFEENVVQLDTFSVPTLLADPL
jgi:anthranilate 1,2-dioxygenase small subunit